LYISPNRFIGVKVAMKKQPLVCALFSLVFILSCSDENSPNGELLPKPLNVSYRIGIEEAVGAEW
jgi:hypothetical protein